MRRRDTSVWPTKRRKRLQRHRQAARPPEPERTPTTDDMALALVMRGLASPLVLSAGGLRRMEALQRQAARNAA